MVDFALLRQRDYDDAAFFAQHADRYAHIRNPITGECRGEFWRIGTHDPSRRRILLWRVPKDNPAYNEQRRPILKLPFLAFADEEIADRDDVLLPIIHEIMANAKSAVGGRG